MFYVQIFCKHKCAELNAARTYCTKKKSRRPRITLQPKSHFLYSPVDCSINPVFPFSWNQHSDENKATFRITDMETIHWPCHILHELWYCMCLFDLVGGNKCCGVMTS